MFFSLISEMASRCSVLLIIESNSRSKAVGTGVAVGASAGVGVEVEVGTAVGVKVCVGASVGVGAGVAVGADVAVGVGAAVATGVLVGSKVGVGASFGVGEGMLSGDAVAVGAEETTGPASPAQPINSRRITPHNRGASLNLVTFQIPAFIVPTIQSFRIAHPCTPRVYQKTLPSGRLRESMVQDGAQLPRSF